MTFPRISVVTVSYNQGEFIRQNIESVLAQNYPNLEHIVVDGGSTDGTVDILRSYPHLLWTSEPDRGQSHALNKGFSRAGGEIIAWLNSDDWYAPGALHAVAEALRRNSIAIGPVQQAARDGSPLEIVPNEERTWHDILKYWVYYSIPAQTGVFFRRELLEEVKRGEGDYIDETLEFGMDFDLWLRLTLRHPLTCRIPQVLAHARMYDENKTGKNMAAAYAEFKRIFRRYEIGRTVSERLISFVIPVNHEFNNIQATLESIAAQDFCDFEIIVTVFDSSREYAAALKSQVIELSGRYPNLGIRCAPVNERRSYSAALAAGISAACAPLAAVLLPGTVVDAVFGHEILRLFQNDSLALALPGPNSTAAAVMKQADGRPVLDWRGLVFDAPLPPNYIVRKVALTDLGDWSEGEEDCILRRMLLRLLYKGWQVSVDNALKLRGHSVSQGGALSSIERSRLIFDLWHEFETDTFAARRLSNGFGVMFSRDEIQAAAGK